MRTEFFESAVKMGFYGIERSGLEGKKDNVRKYWEDVFIKLSIRDIIAEILNRKNIMRVVDLGSGSGEGYELLTHIPLDGPSKRPGKESRLTSEQMIYRGIDISPAMVEQGWKNYHERENVQFLRGDLSEGFPLEEEEPFDVYFSSYCSLSHLSAPELLELMKELCSHIEETGYIVFDLYGRYSSEWPIYWTGDNSQHLPYNMAYLLSRKERDPEKIEWFEVTFWDSGEILSLIDSAAAETNRKAHVRQIKDRSILVGRHIETGLFGGRSLNLRNQTNHLFDRDYRGDVQKMTADMSYLDTFPTNNDTALHRIHEYQEQWNTVIQIMKALIERNNSEVKRLIEGSQGKLEDELKMLAWLYRNAERFPVVDFWASIMGPQIACVLRNLEMGLPDGVGCGHSLFCIVEIRK